MSSSDNLSKCQGMKKMGGLCINKPMSETVYCKSCRDDEFLDEIWNLPIIKDLIKTRNNVDIWDILDRHRVRELIKLKINYQIGSNKYSKKYKLSYTNRIYEPTQYEIDQEIYTILDEIKTRKNNTIKEVIRSIVSEVILIKKILPFYYSLHKLNDIKDFEDYLDNLLIMEKSVQNYPKKIEDNGQIKITTFPDNKLIKLHYHKDEKDEMIDDKYVEYRWINNKNIKMVFFIDYNMLDVSCISYYDNGNRCVQNSYKNCILHGTQFRWLESGEKLYQEDYDHGQKHGKHYTFYKNGNRKTCDSYDHGTVDLTKTYRWDESGIMV